MVKSGARRGQGKSVHKRERKVIREFTGGTKKETWERKVGQKGQLGLLQAGKKRARKTGAFFLTQLKREGENQAKLHDKGPEEKLGLGFFVFSIKGGRGAGEEVQQKKNEQKGEPETLEIRHALVWMPGEERIEKGEMSSSSCTPLGTYPD